MYYFPLGESHEQIPEQCIIGYQMTFNPKKFYNLNMDWYLPKRPYWVVVSLDSERVENPGEERTQCKDDNGNNDDDILSLCSRKLKKIFTTSGAKKWSYENNQQRNWRTTYFSEEVRDICQPNL